MSNLYLKRYAATEELINEPPDAALGMVITIPAFNEKHLIKALKSIRACEPPQCVVEIVVLINYSENAPDDVKQASLQQYHSLKEDIAGYEQKNLNFFILLQELPSKHAGVGLARKILMDEAARRFEKINHPGGSIVAFDADCTCAPTYLTAIERFFRLHPKAHGCSIYFEHHADDQFDSEIYNAAYEYELHLRCYIDALRWCNLPHAFQTIGSSMAVNHKIYQQQGGMNKKKAGEDFYFLHRVIPLGEFGDLTTTTVFPSIRPSDRVPFGTGKAVKKWLEERVQLTYSPVSYPPLKKFVSIVPEFYHADANKINIILEGLNNRIKIFLEQQKLREELQRIKSQSTSMELFIKHFYQWFNAFLVMKYLHFVRENYDPMIPVRDAAEEMIHWHNSSGEYEDLLGWYREFDRQNDVYLEKVY